MILIIIQPSTADPESTKLTSEDQPLVLNNTNNNNKKK